MMDCDRVVTEWETEAPGHGRHAERKGQMKLSSMIKSRIKDCRKLREEAKDEKDKYWITGRIYGLQEGLNFAKRKDLK